MKEEKPQKQSKITKVKDWSKRKIFTKWILEAKEKLNASNIEEVAKYFGLSYSNLASYMAKSSVSQKPNFGVLKILADFLDRDYKELLDDNDAKIVAKLQTKMTETIELDPPKDNFWSKRNVFRLWVQDAKARMDAKNLDAVAELMNISSNLLHICMSINGKYLLDKNTKIPKNKKQQKPDKWPERENFRRALNDYRNKTGKKMEQVAEKLGLSISTLRNIYSATAHVPSIDLRIKIAKLFGISITTLITDPNPNNHQHQ
jgi:transcriptional regulator with XRE-family HTH domain